MVLVTGFGPFLNFKTNISEIAIHSLKVDSKTTKMVLPVSFTKVKSIIEQKFIQFDEILMFGLASKRTHVGLERVALNWLETAQADEDGDRPIKGKISQHDEGAYFNSLPLERWKEVLEAQQIPTEVSLSAGGYVCNYTYFLACDVLKGKSSKVLFVHLPEHLSEQQNISAAQLIYDLFRSA